MQTLENRDAHLISFGKKLENLLFALESGRIGSTSKTFQNHLSKGHLAILHCNSSLWGIAEVCGGYTLESTVIWPDKSYPHRFPIRPVRLFSQPQALSLGQLSDRLKKENGVGWAFNYLFAPKVLPKTISRDFLAAALNVPKTTVDEIKRHIRSEVQSANDK